MYSIGQLSQQLQALQPGTGRLHCFREYLLNVEESDALRLLGLIIGTTPTTKVINEDQLHTLALKITGTPDWLFAAANEVTTEKLETVSLLLKGDAQSSTSLKQILTWRQELATLDLEAQEVLLKTIWAKLSSVDRYFFNRLITGKLRLKNYANDLALAASEVWQLDPHKLRQYVAADWDPSNSRIETLQLHCLAEDYDSPVDLAMQTANFYCLYAHVDPHSDRIYSEVTVAAVDDEKLIPMGKVTTAGMPESDYIQLVKYIHANTIETFGPTKSLKAGLILEVAFSGIERSKRRKSGMELLNSIVLRIMKSNSVVVAKRTLELFCD